MLPALLTNAYRSACYDMLIMDFHFNVLLKFLLCLWFLLCEFWTKVSISDMASTFEFFSKSNLGEPNLMIKEGIRYMEGMRNIVVRSQGTIRISITECI